MSEAGIPAVGCGFAVSPIDVTGLVSSRSALVVTTVVLAVALAVAAALLIPWRPLPLHGLAPSPVDAARDFSAAQIAREDAFHAAVRPPAYVSLVSAC